MSKLNCIVVALSMLFVGCAHDKVINGVEYETYGLVNESEAKSANIHYRLVTGNIFWAIFFVETIGAPIYFFGFSMYEPIRAKTAEELER